MGDNWRNSFWPWSSDDGTLVSPNAPAGGGGRGYARGPNHGALNATSDVPDPRSPAARFFDWAVLSRMDIDDRALAVRDALVIAAKHAPGEIYEATGEELNALLEGLIPGLLMALALVVATTALGGAAGAAIGALAAGVGAAPGAMLGASAGLEAGLALLEGLGLAFLAAAIGTSLAKATQLSTAAIQEAWRAIDDPHSRDYHVDHSGRTFAKALGAMMHGILQGLVAYLMEKGAQSAAARVPELVAKLRSSRLGRGFATWVERNWSRLVANKKLRPPEKPATSGGGSAGEGGGVGETGPAAKPRPKAKSEETAPQESAPEKPKEEPNESPPRTRADILRDMQDVAKNGDVSTPEDGLYLWSGGGMNGAGGAAKSAAEASGGKTLEMTPAGKELGRLQEELGPYDSLTPEEKLQTNEAWTTASERLAAQAEGDVTVVTDPSKMRSNAIIFDELGRMEDNPNITSVTVTDTSGNVISQGSASDAAAALRARVP